MRSVRLPVSAVHQRNFVVLPGLRKGPNSQKEEVIQVNYLLGRGQDLLDGREESPGMPLS